MNTKSHNTRGKSNSHPNAVLATVKNEPGGNGKDKTVVTPLQRQKHETQKEAIKLDTPTK
jgi:hypothetical protein